MSPGGGERHTDGPTRLVTEGVDAGWFFQWTPDDEPGGVLSVPATPTGDAWEELRKSYCGDARVEPFERLVEVAIAHGVCSVVIERRYIDLDYRDEHTHFYGSTFKRYPSVAHRLHFFTAPVDPDLGNLQDVADSYRGYSIMRPLRTAPVGRTMLAPPPDLAGATLCLATDVVHLWGQELRVRGMPFTSQDMEYMRCAHAALWMMLYHAHLRHGAPRRLPYDIHEASSRAVVNARRIPSDGLMPSQVVTVLQNLGMSSYSIQLPKRRSSKTVTASPELSLFGILCRSVNSQLPPLVYSDDHAWVVVGYRIDNAGKQDEKTVLFIHNDVRGPYLPVPSPFVDEQSVTSALGEGTVWSCAVPPFPLKVYLTGERAEQIGKYRLDEFAKASRGGKSPLAKLSPAQRSWRCYALRSYEYKERARTRLPKDIAMLITRAHLPRWVWVVEVRDRRLVAAGKPAVLGEVVIDATASHLADADDPVVLVRHLSGEAFSYTPDHGVVYQVDVTLATPTESALHADDGQTMQARSGS